jgi:methionyl-tRNA formyltransferase
VTPKPQDEALATYTGRIRRRDGFIDLNMGALYVHNTIRAYSHPYFGAYFYHNGEKITVWKSVCEKWSGNQGRAGEIIGRSPDGVEIACGEGSVILVGVFQD